MTLTRNFKRTIAACIARDPAFARALLAEALTLFLKGEPNEAQMILISLFGPDKPTYDLLPPTV